MSNSTSNLSLKESSSLLGSNFNTKLPQSFKPFQKQPNKKEKFMKRIDRHNLPMTVNELAQIM